jgi:methyl-accepting chemotaxis protein
MQNRLQFIIQLMVALLTLIAQVIISLHVEYLVDLAQHSPHSIEEKLAIFNAILWVGQLGVQIILFLIVRKIALTISNPVVDLQQAMTNMDRESNISYEVPLAHNKDEVYSMAQAFNSLIQRLRNALKSINVGGAQVSQAAADLTKTAQHIANTAQKQQSQADQVAQSVYSIQSTVAEVKNQVQQASDISQQAWHLADQGNHVVLKVADNIQHLAEEVNQTADVIAKLNAESERVNAIVDTIRDIAEQTNLLALNAAIEAARAGEQGRGFAVVADEVRTLSIRTSQATHEISKVINDMQRETDHAVRRMRTLVEQVSLGVSYSQEAAETLTQIRDASTKTSDRIQEITQAMQQQLHAAEHIAREVNAIAAMIQENSQASHHTLKASEQLKRLAENLDQQVHQFRV